MERKLYALTLLLFACGATTVSAKDLTPNEAEQLADQFVNTRHLLPSNQTKASQFAARLVYSGPESAASQVKTSGSATSKTSNVANGSDSSEAAEGAPYYIFNYGTTTFVIIAGDDRMTPVLGYSDSGAFDVNLIPDNVASWLAMYAAEYAALQREPEGALRPVFSTATAAKYPDTVSPLLGDIAWNQGEPFNDLCPTYDSKPTVTGCVATAMAQIMKYHAYPAVGTGSNSYTTSTLKIPLACNFDTLTLDWSNMLPAYTKGNYSAEQALAVAELMSACGISVNMDYTTSSSGANTARVADALADHFSYDSNVQYLLREMYDYADWLNLIKEELSAGRPVLYDGFTTTDGHAFVFDGYDSSDRVHVNWGWGGSCNGYFEVTALNPSSVGIGGGNGNIYGFNFSQGMVVGIQKPSADSKFRTGFTVEELLPSATALRKGDEFSVQLREVLNYGANYPGGKVAIILDKDGRQTVLGSQDMIATDSYYGFSKISFDKLTVPASLEEGSYTLYSAASLSGKEDWSQIRCKIGQEGIYRATVKGDSLYLTDYWGAFDLTATMSIDTPLYAGFEGDFHLAYTNHNEQSEVYAPAGVAIRTADGKLVKDLELGQLYLWPKADNERRDYSVTIPSTLAAGTYEFIPVALYGNYWVALGDGVTAEVLHGTKTDNDSVLVTPIKVKFDKEEYCEDDDITLSFTLTNKSQTEVYSRELYIYFFKSGGGESEAAYGRDVTVYPASSKTFTYTFSPKLKKDKYFVMIMGSDWLNSAWTDGFSCCDLTALSDVDVEASAIAYLPQADLLRIRLAASSPTSTGSAVTPRVDLYDASGRLAASFALASSADELEQEISLRTLPAGAYIVRVQTADGVVVGRIVK